MRKLVLAFMLFLASTPVWSTTPDATPQHKDKGTLAQEGEALRYQAITPSEDGYLVVDSAKLRQSVERLSAYMKDNKKTETKYVLLLADNYFLLHQFPKATEIFQSRQSDGLSQLRLGEMLYNKYAPKNTLHKAIYYLNRGLSASSICTKDFNQAYITASRILPLCYFQMGDLENARRYHRAYTKDNDPETYMWLYHLYWQAGKKEDALQCAQQAMQLDSTNPIYSEQVASCYFNLGKNDLAFPYWQKAAQQGSLLGHIRLGQSYVSATGCERNDSLAIVHLELGLDSLDWMWAQKLLGQLYIQGDSLTNPNYNILRAHYWLTKASDKGDWKSKQLLAESLAHYARVQTDKAVRGRMMQQANVLAIQLAARNYNDSVAWYVLSSFVGDSLLSQPKPDLAVLKSKRKYLAIDMQRDMQICQLLAASGSIDEIVQLGKAYSTGIYAYNDYLAHRSYRIDTNYVAALKYWQQGLAIDSKNIDCIKGVTDAYSYGWGVKKDVIAAKRFWEEHGMFNYASTYFYPWRTYRIRQGNIDEVIYMFSFYDPTKLNMSISESLRWLRNATTNGNKEQRSVALYLLGGIYEKGAIVEVNHEMAVNYYKQSAELDNANANHRLADLYKNGGCGVLRNMAAAARYFRRCYQISGNQEDYLQYIECTNQQ